MVTPKSVVRPVSDRGPGRWGLMSTSQRPTCLIWVTTLWPWRKALPAVTLTSPVSILNVVVFPAPFWPSRPKHSCSGTPTHTWSTAVNLPYCWKESESEKNLKGNWLLTLTVKIRIHTLASSSQDPYKHKSRLYKSLSLTLTLSLSLSLSLSGLCLERDIRAKRRIHSFALSN